MATQSSCTSIDSELRHVNHSAQPSIALSNIASLILVRLDDSNYFIWKALFELVLHSSQLMNHVDGSCIPPN
jgi:hypothetical protein